MRIRSTEAGVIERNTPHAGRGGCSEILPKDVHLGEWDTKVLPETVQYASEIDLWRWVEVADHPFAHLTPIGTDFYEPQQIRLNSRPACAIGVPRRSGGVCMAAQKVGQIDRRGDGTWLVRVVVPGIADHRSGIGVEPGTPQSELSRR